MSILYFANKIDATISKVVGKDNKRPLGHHFTFNEARKALMEYYSYRHQDLLAEAEQAHEKFTKVFMMDEPAEK